MENENPEYLAEAKRELGISEVLHGDKSKIALYLARKYELDRKNSKWWGNAYVGGWRCMKCFEFRDNEFTQRCNICDYKMWQKWPQTTTSSSSSEHSTPYMDKLKLVMGSIDIQSNF